MDSLPFFLIVLTLTVLAVWLLSKRLTWVVLLFLTTIELVYLSIESATELDPLCLIFALLAYIAFKSGEGVLNENS